VTPFRFLLLLLFGTYVLADLLVLRGPVDQMLERWLNAQRREKGEVARVAGESVSSLELARALRHRLFRQGLEWNAMDAAEQDDQRRAALEVLVENALLRAARVAEGREAHPRAVNAEVDDFIAEFHPRAEFHRRLGLQGMSEAALVNQISDQVADQAWLESKLTLTAPGAPPASEAPEVWRVSHVFLSAHEKNKPDRSAEMNAIYAKLQNGESTFEKLAAEYSEDERTKRRGGDLGWIAAPRTPADFMNAVRTQTRGTVSAPVRTKLGWHLIRVTDYQPARPADEQVVMPEWRAANELGARVSEVETLLQNLRNAQTDAVIIHEARLAKVLPLGYPVRTPSNPPSS